MADEKREPLVLGESVVLRQLSFFGVTPRNTIDLRISQRERKYVVTYDCSRFTELGEALASFFFECDSCLGS